MSDNYITWEEAVRWLRNQPDQQNLVRFCYYDDPLEQAAARYAESEEWQAVLGLLAGKIPSSVLDIGAGRGISSYAFAKSGCTVTAFEPDPSALVGTRAIRELFAKAGLPVSIVEEKGERLPFPDNTFDIVYGRAVFHHARDIGIFCREAYRVLKSDGIFLMTREHVITRKEDLQAFLDAHPLHRLYGGEHAYRAGEYIHAIRQAGIELTLVLNPFQSDINLYPDTKDSFKERMAASIKWPWPQVIPDAILTLMGRLIRTPGRLYSFIGRKPA
jgi:SAM-dependent methyltransferase